MAYLHLPDPVDAAKALFDLIRVPRKVVVDHEVAALKVYTFAGRIIRDQNQHISVLHKTFNDLPPLFTSNTPVDDLNSLWPTKPSADFFKEVVKRVLRLSEYDEFPSIAVGIDHQIVIKNLIELRPFRVFA
ncbi:hypothetical protein D3C73_367550 [compost metagenome]